MLAAGMVAVGILAAGAPAARAAARMLTSLPKVFSDDFESGSPDRWEPSDPAAWRVETVDGQHVYSQFRQSQVKTPVRSPFNRALVRGLTVGDFVLDARVQSTARDYNHRDLCLFFGYRDPAHLYYVHLGQKTDEHANQIFIVDGKPRRKISTQTTAGTHWDNGWHRVRVARDVQSGAIDVYFDDLKSPVMHAVDKTFTSGRLGVGSFDDTGRFDDVLVLADRADDAAAAAPAEAPEGFVPLFNGNDLSGWKGLVGNPKSRAAMSPEQLAAEQKKADAKMRAHWRVVDGVIVFDGKGDSLCTAKDYGDFELLVDWKIDKAGDSGIYLRGSPQVQIWDCDEPTYHVHGAEKGSGALWNNAKHERFPVARADKPVGQWNTFRIRMVGDRVTVYLNDKLVTDNVVMENYWEKGKPIYPAGQIELQNHSHELFFRNIFIKELPAK